MNIGVTKDHPIINFMFGCISGFFGCIMVYMGASEPYYYANCLGVGVILIMLSAFLFFCVYYGIAKRLKVDEEEQENNQDGQICMENISEPDKPDEDDYEYIEVKSYVRRKKK